MKAHDNTEGAGPFLSAVAQTAG